MNQAWSEFLSRRGARIVNGDVVGFDLDNKHRYQSVEEGFLCELSADSWLSVAGPDADSFLQGQLTNDVAALDARHAQLQGYCNPKGRLICLFRAVRHGGGFLLQLPADLGSEVKNRLQKYVLRAKVTLGISDDLVGVGVAGPASVDLLRRCFGVVPPMPGEYLDTGALGLCGLPGSVPRVQVVGAVPDVCALWDLLSESLAPVGPVPWALLDIGAGIPRIESRTSELFVPQMVNLDLIGAVSFDKGCYPGQEIVARMHYLGKLKQRMIRARVVTDSAPQPGDRLYTAERGEQSAGTVLNAQPVGPRQYELLAIVQLSGHVDGNLRARDPKGPALSHLSLPYEVPVD